MVYNSISIENVIGRILRNTKLSDTSAIADIYEWITEAMELMETQAQLEKLHADLNIKFHQALSPCGMAILDAVEYNGKRLNYSNTSSNVKAEPQAIARPGDSVLQTTPIVAKNSVTGDEFLTSDLTAVNNLAKDPYNFYYTKLNYICTSMKEAKIRVFYQGVPLCPSGFPLIPDNGNYKEALYWWVRGKLIGSGQLEDKNNTENSCLIAYERYAARAIGEITYPSIDRMERLRANQLRYIAPENYWENHYKI